MSCLKICSMENKFGKTSTIRLSTRKKDGKAILEDVYFTAPFKIMSPFYQSPDSMQVMMLTASAGIMEGDVQEFEFTIGSGTTLEFCSQSFEKIHKMKTGQAVRHTAILIEEDAFFYYNPLPTIPFKDSAFKNTMDIRLASDTSRLVLCEILSCGRSASGECFAYRYYHSLIQVYKGGRLIYRDNTRYEPQLFGMESLGMYEGYTHLANLLVCNLEKDVSWQERVRELIDGESKVTGGVTKLASGDYVVRILGRQAQKLQELCKAILEL